MDRPRVYFKTDALAPFSAATEVPKPIEFSTIGRDRCEYLVKVATKALYLISRLEYRRNTLTREEFVTAYRTYDIDHEERIAFICLKFVSIYETIFKLRPTWELYHDVFHSRFPVIGSWTRGNINDMVRLPRNSIAHGFEVAPSYWEDCDEETARNKFSEFSPSTQWDTMETEIPPLEKELRNLVKKLDGAMPSITKKYIGIARKLYGEENGPSQYPWQTSFIPALQINHTKTKNPPLEKWGKLYMRARQVSIPDLQIDHTKIEKPPLETWGKQYMKARQVRNDLNRLFTT
jgi:hypothetical protein